MTATDSASTAHRGGTLHRAADRRDLGAAIGAYLDWLWWHPTQGIVVSLMAIAAILLVGLLFLFVARSPPGWPSLALPSARALLLGQWIGPSREALAIATGP